jgi:nitrogen fixation-related uncharacterized protein
MDNSILFIVIGSSVLFIGVVVWKILWLLKKMDSDQAAAEESD